jgi:hypothetical protein
LEIREPFDMRMLDLRKAGGNCLQGIRLEKIVPALEMIVFPEKIEEMSDSLCADLYHLRVVLAHHCVRLWKIGDNAVAFCLALQELLLPDSVTEIGTFTLLGTQLVKLDLSGCSLARASLEGRTQLEKLRLPSTLKDLRFSGIIDFAVARCGSPRK